MKTTQSHSQRLLTFIIFILFTSLNNYAQTLPFHLSKGAGTFRLGVIHKNESVWLDQCTINEKKQIYTINNKLWENGNIQITVCPLTKSNGFILEVSGKQLPKEITLCWAFGACNEAKKIKITNNEIPITSCYHNVFSIEGNAFTTYYGESMRLKTVHGLSPLNSNIHLADAKQQSSPITLIKSGKKTDAPIIAATCSWKTEEKLYFCFYQQADYNYFMLPDLFEKEFKKLSK